MTPDQIRAHRETVLLRLLIRVAQTETADLVDRLHAAGHGRVNRAHITLLGNIDTEGTRLVEIARRLGVTRQAASQMVGDIEKRGFVERAADPDDGRAQRVRHTQAGRAMLVDALALMHEIEQGYEAVIGKRAMAQLRTSLSKIAQATDAAAALGSPG
ncbi:MarR family transcriptional regulator [Nocardioides humilatus]|uniref:MarR family transcriptional regulator n=2 Tax=Nocardioides humilatus TaxID=2607660 RepID=A0A5B1LG48_9ACTN|nr:MarR family transcriptional regulator [Nocardioides humilatus]